MSREGDNDRVQSESMKDESGTSRFWERISGRHRSDLEKFGYDAIKRRQALEYFTWQWGFGRSLLDPQLRFLIRHTPASSWKAAWRQPLPPAAAWAGVPWSRGKRRLYTLATRLLWQFASEHGHQRVLELPEPEIGGPLPVRLHGRLISQDLANTSLELAAMIPALGRPRSFLEVGAGYGRNAYALMSLYPEASYTIVDIEPALSISRWYLTQLFDPARLRFLAPEDSSSIGDVDVALTISSLHEMTPRTVESYLRLFDRTAHYVYLKQWTEWWNPDDRITMKMAEYPFPARWRSISWSLAPVQSGFTQALWAVHSGV
jgi:putative sugar O-methyltransferase